MFPKATSPLDFVNDEKGILIFLHSYIVSNTNVIIFRILQLVVGVLVYAVKVQIKYAVMVFAILLKVINNFSLNCIYSTSFNYVTPP